MNQKIVWSYSERTLTGWTIFIIGGIGATLGDIVDNPLALALGIFALLLGTARVFYAHGVRDTLNMNRDADDLIKDFDLTSDPEDQE